MSLRRGKQNQTLSRRAFLRIILLGGGRTIVLGSLTASKTASQAAAHEEAFPTAQPNDTPGDAIRIGSIIQSTFGSPGNFEALIQEGTSLVHYFHDNADINLPWTRAQTITTTATGPGCIIQSTFGASSRPGNFEVVVQEGTSLVHYFHDNADINLPWTRAQIITDSATGPGWLIPSNIGSGAIKNFEVLARECSQSVVHYWHPNQVVAWPWQRGQVLLFEPRLPALDWTHKVAQLTGEYDRDRTSWNGMGAPPFARNRTETNVGLRGTDLGSSFVHAHQLYFLFGDTYWNDARRNNDFDNIAVADLNQRAYEGLSLRFNRGAPIVSPTTPQNGFNVPLDGFSLNGSMYVFFSTDAYKVDANIMMGRSILASSDDGGVTFQLRYTLSSDKFVNVSVERVGHDQPGYAPGLSDGLLVWGSGRYRASDIYLAYLPLGVATTGADKRFFAGTTGPNNATLLWSAREDDAVPLTCAGCIGEFSVRWNPYLRRWLMMYNSGNPRGIIIRHAPLPWGLWSEPQLAFDPAAGYGKFMHIKDNNDLLDDQMFGLSRLGEWGGEYGPYIIAPYATGLVGRYSKVYFTLSTWNPYQTMQMSTVVTIDGTPLDSRAYATDLRASREQKYARISVLQAELATQYGVSWDVPAQGNQCSADHLEWALFHSAEELRAELKAKARQLITRVALPNDKAEIYARVTVDLIYLGGGKRDDSDNIAAHRTWALDAINDGNGNLLFSETDARLDRKLFITDDGAQIENIYLPIIS